MFVSVWRSAMHHASGRLAHLVQAALSWCILPRLHRHGAVTLDCIKSVHARRIDDFSGQIEGLSRIHYLFAHGQMLA
jgi:hypothetical protein